MPKRFALPMVVLLLQTQSLVAVTVGQIDKFNDGIAAWKVGGGNNVVGPFAVVGDNSDGESETYLHYSTDVENTGGRFLIINASQWAGDYLASSVSGISAIARNAGDVDLHMRLLLEGTGGMFLTEPATVLPVGGDWQSMFFSIDVDTLIGDGDVTETLSDVRQIRIFHNPDPSFPGPFAVGAGMDIDSIQAVPEPGGMLVLALSGGLLLLWRHRRPHKLQRK